MLALERAQLLLVEDLVDEALVAHGHDVAVLGGRDAGRLLAAVLERVEREVGQPRDLVLRREYAEDAALVTGSFASVEEGVLVHGRRATVATGPAAPHPSAAVCGVSFAAAERATRTLPSRVTQYPGQRPRRLCPSTSPSRSTASGSASSSSARRSGSTRRPPKSAETYRRAHEVLSGGVASSYQLRDPWPIYLERATARASGTSTATSTSTSTTASARWSRATRTPRSARAAGALRQRHALRRPDRGRDRGRRGPAAPLGPGPLALHELRLGVDDGRDPDRARLHGPRHRDEDLRLLPRPPRHGDGLDRRRVRQDRRPREPRLAALRRGHPAGRRRT